MDFAGATSQKNMLWPKPKKSEWANAEKQAGASAKKQVERARAPWVQADPSPGHSQAPRQTIWQHSKNQEKGGARKAHFG